MNKTYWWAGGVSILLLGIVFFKWSASMPALEGSPEALRTLDALFTAVTAKDIGKVHSSAKKLEELGETQGISQAALLQVRRCGRYADEGEWTKSAELLYRLISEQ